MLRLLRKTRQGQASIEYSVIIIIAIAAVLLTSNYIRRSLMGGIKKSVDQLGDQYDPRFANGVTNYTYASNTTTTLTTFQSTNGYATMREDTTNAVENREGWIHVESF